MPHSSSDERTPARERTTIVGLISLMSAAVNAAIDAGAARPDAFARARSSSSRARYSARAVEALGQPLVDLIHGARRAAQVHGDAGKAGNLLVEFARPLVGLDGALQVLLLLRQIRELPRRAPQAVAACAVAVGELRRLT